MKTYLPKSSEVNKKWWLIDAEGQTLGRLSSKIALILKGKTKPEYTPNVDVGDFVVVINAEKVKVSGKKELQKEYNQHTGIIGNLKTTTVEKLRQKHPERIIELSVKGMLPKNTLGRSQFKKLKVYKGADHPHTSQKPEVLSVN